MLIKRKTTWNIYVIIKHYKLVVDVSPSGGFLIMKLGDDTRNLQVFQYINLIWTAYSQRGNFD